jgi:N-acetylneuraminic acid mutarotase
MRLSRRQFAALALAAPFLATHNSKGAGGWRSGPPMPTARSELTGATLGGRIYAADGVAQLGITPAMQLFDPAAGEWRPLSSVPQGRHHAAMAALGGRLILTGGFDNLPFGAGDAVDETWIYHPDKDSWRLGPAMPGRRAAHAVAVAGDRLYVVGGVGANPEKLYAFDAAAGSWEILPTALPTLREHLAAATVDGRIHAIAGRWNGGVNKTDHEIYDPAGNSWIRGPDLPTARSGLGSAVIRGRIHVLGGEDYIAGKVFSEHEVFDPATGAWSSESPLPTARHGLMVTMESENLYVIGGGEAAAALTILNLSDKMEIWSPSP